MNQKLVTALLTAITAVTTTATAFGQASSMPGDHGKPGTTGIPAVPNPNAPPPAPRPPEKKVRGPSIDVALKLVQAVASECKQYPLGVAVVNSEGLPIITYIPDGSPGFHTYTAIRKAYSAITLKASTIDLISKAQTDAEFASKIKADPNLMVFGGGIPLKVGDEFIGALGVSGAEPGGHDDECGHKALDVIKGQLK